jgi:2-oxoglutarate decarboxylase
VSSATPGNPLTDFGANEWLVNEMYERYRENPDSVSAGWREFFGGDPTNAHLNGEKPAPEQAKAAPAPAPEPVEAAPEPVKAEPVAAAPAAVAPVASTE